MPYTRLTLGGVAQPIGHERVSYQQVCKEAADSARYHVMVLQEHLSYALPRRHLANREARYAVGCLERIIASLPPFEEEEEPK